MITKIKELMQIKGDIDKITVAIDEQTKVVENNQKESLEFQRLIFEINSENKKIISQIKKDVSSFIDFRSDLKKELYEFKLFKKELRSVIEEKIKSEFGSLISAAERDVNGFNEIKKKLETKHSKIEKLELEIEKLTDVINKIKGTDFELVKYESILEKHNKEKLDLLRKIDQLERLIAKSRRRN